MTAETQETLTPAVTTFSYGGGQQSTAALVLQRRGAISYEHFLFCNVGHDSERRATIEYVEHVAKPYAAHHGISLIELERIKRDGTVETLMGRLTKEGSRSLPIPVRMSNGAPGQRACTADFKIKVVAKWLRAHGATADTPALTALGISTDEAHRARTNSGFDYQLLEYPLIDLNLRRTDCQRIIAEEPWPEELRDGTRQAVAEGWLTGTTAAQLRDSRHERMPLPPPSACFFCPFHRPSEWQRMAIEEPEEFAKSIELEELLNRRREMLGKDPVWLTRFNRPLNEVVNDAQQVLPLAGEGADLDNCESGYCMI